MMKMMKMIPTHVSDYGIQYTLTNPNFTFKKEINDKFLKVKITNNIGDILFDDIAKIKYIDDCLGASYLPPFPKWRYHLESKDQNVNIFIVTDTFDKINCMSINYERIGNIHRVEFKTDDRKTEYSTNMSVDNSML